MPLTDFLLGIVIPPLALLPMFQLYRVIDRKPDIVLLPLESDVLLFLLFFIATIISLGNGMHLAAVSIDRKTIDLTEEEKDLLHVIDFFHHSFSHAFIFIPILIGTFLYLLFEINHPELNALPNWQIYALAFFGLVVGLVFGMAVIEGSGAVLFIPILAIILLVTVILDKYLHLDLRRLPLMIFLGTSYMTHLLLLLVWGFHYRGWPEVIGELVKIPGIPARRRDNKK